jgi:hypothetical protein
MPLTKSPDSTIWPSYFSGICRTFRSGGTRIRTGDTMIFSHMQKPLGMRICRIGKLICVQGVPLGTSWFCPYCCATVDMAFVTLSDPTRRFEPLTRFCMLRPKWCQQWCHPSPPCIADTDLTQLSLLTWRMPYPEFACAGREIRRLPLPPLPERRRQPHLGSSPDRCATPPPTLPLPCSSSA